MRRARAIAAFALALALTLAADGRSGLARSQEPRKPVDVAALAAELPAAKVERRAEIVAALRAAGDTGKKALGEALDALQTNALDALHSMPTRTELEALAERRKRFEELRKAVLERLPIVAAAQTAGVEDEARKTDEARLRADADAMFKLMHDPKRVALNERLRAKSADVQWVLSTRRALGLEVSTTLRDPVPAWLALLDTSATTVEVDSMMLDEGESARRRASLGWLRERFPRLDISCYPPPFLHLPDRVNSAGWCLGPIESLRVSLDLPVLEPFEIHRAVFQRCENEKTTEAALLGALAADVHAVERFAADARCASLRVTSAPCDGRVDSVEMITQHPAYARALLGREVDAAAFFRTDAGCWLMLGKRE